MKLKKVRELEEPRSEDYKGKGIIGDDLRGGWLEGNIVKLGK